MGKASEGLTGMTSYHDLELPSYCQATVKQLTHNFRHVSRTARCWDDNFHPRYVMFTRLTQFIALIDEFHCEHRNLESASNLGSLPSIQSLQHWICWREIGGCIQRSTALFVSHRVFNLSPCAPTHDDLATAQPDRMFIIATLWSYSYMICKKQSRLTMVSLLGSPRSFLHLSQRIYQGFSECNHTRHRTREKRTCTSLIDSIRMWCHINPDDHSWIPVEWLSTGR